jgi:hypothetical protein
MRAALLLIVLVTPLIPRGNDERQPVSRTDPPPIFRFHNSFWSNLHHFLYVVGRGRNDPREARRPVIAAALEDELRGAGTLGSAERTAWDEAVFFYRNGPSKLNAVFDKTLSGNARAIAAAADAPALGAAVPDQALAQTLQSAAPIYRKVWWERHRAANASHVAEMQALIQKHGQAVLARLMRAYAEPWPLDGRAIEICGYANWSGAYSTDGGLIVVSSLDPLTKGAHGFEILFHEAIHQWDDQVFEVLRAEARRQNKQVPANLSHAMIFYTSGDAVRREISGHVTYAELNGMWKFGSFAPFKAALDRAWLPWLDGEITRQAALARLIGES